MDKPTQWAAQTPWLTLWHDPDLLEHLVAAPNSQMAKPKLDLYREGRWDDVLIGTFLSSRVFNLKGKQKGAGQTQPGRVLMPFIDFLNHHFHARGFQTETAETWDDNKIFVYQDQPLEGSDQCFVMYSMLDCYASFLSYGFIDESAPFISSHPTTVELSQGVKLQVGRNLAGTFKKQLPQKMRDLRIYMPQVGAEGSNGIPVSRLLFPGSNAPRALRRVLATILRSKRPQWDAVTVEAAVREAERKLLDANHRHYDRLAELTAEARMRSEDEDVPGRKATLRTVDQLVFRSKRHLYAYADRLSD
jgi:hypothetical protein